MSDSWDGEDGQTIAIMPCADHPPLVCWPERNLITGCCPDCGTHFEPEKSARVMRAKQIIREREL